MHRANEVAIEIAADRSEVRIHAPAGITPAQVSPAALSERLREQHVLVDPPVIQRLEAFSLTVGMGEHDHTAPVAWATPPVMGAPGRIAWAPGMDPTRASTASPASAGSTDHHHGRHYPRIVAGTRLGRLIPPEAGTPGRDVLGGEINSTGESAAKRLDASILCDATGTLVAQRDGLLVERGEMIRICDSLEISGFVDFATGNIDAEGNVEVRGGVRPGFKVSASGSLTIQGQVEGAELACGACLTLATGMAGGGKGAVHVAGNAKVGYIDGTTGTIKGTLEVEREMVDSRLVIGGSLLGPGATVFGGEIAVTGSCVIGTLGSEAYKPTTLILGDVPLLNRLTAESCRVIKSIDARIAQLRDKERILRVNPRPNPTDREQLTVLAFELQELIDERAARAGVAENIDSAAKASRKLDVEIHRVILPHVKLVIGSHIVEFPRPLKGPVRIFWDPQGSLLCRLGSAEPIHLDVVAHVARVVAPPATTTAHPPTAVMHPTHGPAHHQAA